MEQYCSYVPNIIVFRISHERDFLVFGVPNAKYLAFGTPDGNALMSYEPYLIILLHSLAKAQRTTHFWTEGPMS